MHSTAKPPRTLRQNLVIRVALGLCLCVAFGSCDVAQNGLHSAAGATTDYPDLNLALRPCAIQTAALLSLAQLPAHLTPELPASSQIGDIGPYHDLGGGPVYPGSVGNAGETFQWSGFMSGPIQGVPAGGLIYVTRPTQVFQLAEEIDDWGTLGNAERWMATQRESNQPNAIPDFGNGVERVATTPALGDDSLLYQIDDGATYNSAPHTGPYVGHIYTSLEVRDGHLMFAVSLDSGPAAGPATLAVTIIRSLIAKERSVCQ
jgi:hypothetical protein